MAKPTRAGGERKASQRRPRPKVTRQTDSGANGTAIVAGSTVRAFEANAQTTRYKRRTQQDQVVRFVKWVKVAASRNAGAVASTHLKVVRSAETGKSAFRSRTLRRSELTRLRDRGGSVARKMASYEGEYEEITDRTHPLVRLLEKANPRDNYYGLMELTQLFLGLTGNAYWYKNMAGGLPVEIWPLPPQHVHVIPDRERFIAGYVYGRGTENERTFDASEIVHFRNPNPMGDPYYGLGDLAACIDDADLSVAFTQLALATIDNGAMPGLVLVAKNGLTKPQRDEAETELERKYSGVAKAGRSLLLSGDITVTLANMTEKEIGFLNSASQVKETIANCFDMPMALLTLDSAALATAKAAIPQWEQMAIRPRCRRIEDYINQNLCPHFGDDLFVVFDEAVSKDQEAEATRITNIWNSDLMRLNEARAALGLDPDEEAKDGYKSERMPKPDPFGLAAGGAGGPDDRAGPGGRDQGRGVGDGEPGREDDDPDAERPPAKAATANAELTIIHRVEQPAAARAEALAPETVKVLSAADLVFSGGKSHACCHSASSAAKYDRDTGVVMSMTEKELESRLYGWFVGHVTPAVTGPGAITGDGLVAGLGGDATLAETFDQAVSGPLSSMFLRGYNRGASDVRDTGATMDLLQSFTAPVEGYLRKFTGRLYSSVSSTVTQRINNALADGVAAGESVHELTQRASTLMGTVSTYAPERIARTETARAYLSARENAWEDSGVVKGKEWLLSADPCEFCEAMARDYATALVGQPFLKLGDTLTGSDGGSMSMDYTAMETPPLHPSCRCSLGAIFKE